MMLIDADMLKEWVENWFTMNRNYHPYSKSNNIPITELYDILERIPTVAPIKVGDVCKECWRGGGDVVQVVRCKDCVYYHKADRGHPDTERCKRLICGTVKPDFYCADGTYALTSEETKARK